MDANRRATLWYNARLAPTANPRQVIENGAMVVRDDIIIWLGRQADLPTEYGALRKRRDCARQWITPGLIDCHTHMVYAGERAGEFAQRLAGRSHAEIARSGGGILATVFSTREASEETLLHQSARRLEALLAEGVTTVEIKSGYGLDLKTERKILRVARRLGMHYPVTVTTTFLGAHALPPEYQGRANAYIKEVCAHMLPTLHEEGLVDAVDVYCENIGFSLAQSERVYKTAQALGLPVKMHAEQLSNLGGTQLASQYRALSVDHLEHLQEEDVAAMKRAGTIAVLLPGTFYFLREIRLPPIELLRRYQIPIAIATDCNPGTSPTTSLLLMLNMACTLFGLTVDEALAGATVNAARALGRGERHGTLAIGRPADFALWAIDSLSELVYWTGMKRCSGVVRNGIYRSSDSFAKGGL